MERFQFRLQRYLELKQQEEKLQKILLLQARHEYQRQLDRLGEVDRELRSLLAAGRQARLGAAEVDYLVCAELYHQTLMTRRGVRIKAVAEAGAKVDQALERLLALQRDGKLLGKLREKQWSAYRQAFLSQAQKELDEMASARYVGRRRKKS